MLPPYADLCSSWDERLDCLTVRLESPTESPRIRYVANELRLCSGSILYSLLLPREVPPSRGSFCFYRSFTFLRLRRDTRKGRHS